MANCAVGAEDAELGCGVGRDRPVCCVVQSHEGRAADGSQHLCGPEQEQLRVDAARDSAGERNGGIEIGSRAAEGLSHQHSAKNGEGPASGDDHPACVCCVGLAQGDAGVDAVAEEDQNKGTHEFAEPDRVHNAFLERAE